MTDLIFNSMVDRPIVMKINIVLLDSKALLISGCRVVQTENNIQSISTDFGANIGLCLVSPHSDATVCRGRGFTLWTEDCPPPLLLITLHPRLNYEGLQQESHDWWGTCMAVHGHLCVVKPGSFLSQGLAKHLPTVLLEKEAAEKHFKGGSFEDNRHSMCISAWGQDVGATAHSHTWAIGL